MVEPTEIKISKTGDRQSLPASPGFWDPHPVDRFMLLDFKDFGGSPAVVIQRVSSFSWGPGWSFLSMNDVGHETGKNGNVKRNNFFQAWRPSTSTGVAKAFWSPQHVENFLVLDFTDFGDLPSLLFNVLRRFIGVPAHPSSPCITKVTNPQQTDETKRNRDIQSWRPSKSTGSPRNR